MKTKDSMQSPENSMSVQAMKTPHSAMTFLFLLKLKEQK